MDGRGGGTHVSIRAGGGGGGGSVGADGCACEGGAGVGPPAGWLSIQ